ncbi:hypothetical protein ACWD8I_09355 [Micromonospora arida]
MIGEASSDIRVESGDRTSGVTGFASAPYKGAEWKLSEYLVQSRRTVHYPCRNAGTDPQPDRPSTREEVLMPDQTVAGMALANLIEERRRQLSNPSYRAIAESGGLKSHMTVYNLATKPLKAMPEAGTLEGLARGLDLDLAIVTRAAQSACGYHVWERALPDDPTKQMIIANIEDLEPHELDAVATVVQAYLRSRK